MNKLTTFFLFLTLVNIVELKAKEQGCFFKHINDAIIINKERLPLYANFTNGESKKLSKGLIRFERLIIPLSIYFDRKARKFQKAGVNVLCHDLIDMKFTPAFASQSTSNPLPSHLVPVMNIEKLSKELKDEYKEKGWDPFKKIILREIHKIEKTPSYLCLTRHFLESIGRTASLAPYYQKKAPQHLKKKLEGFLWKYNKAQIFGLKKAYKLDQKALKIQERGVPIYCQDVPPIDVDALDVIARFLD